MPGTTPQHTALHHLDQSVLEPSKPSADSDADFPRFLNREPDWTLSLVVPPPLPRIPVSEHLLPAARRAWGMVQARGRITGSVLTGIVLVPVVLSTYAAWPFEAPGKTITERPESEVRRALETVAQIETRLGYAPQLGRQIEPRESTSASARNVSGSVPSTADSAFAGETLGLYLVHNLPEGATFQTGASAGAGTWAMAADSPDQLVTKLGNGFDRPVRAEIEMISRTGLTLGTIALTLLKSPLIAEAAPVGEPVAIETSHLEQAAANPAAPAPDRQRIQVHKTKTKVIAVAESGKRRRAKQGNDAWKPKQLDESRPADAEIATNDGANDSKPGFFSKMFSWLKSGGSKSYSDEQVTPSALGVKPVE